MKNYLIESMASYMDKMEKSMSQRKRLNESLTEARNPENDEVNAIIRKWANSDRNRLSKKDKEILDKNGISLKDEDSATKQHVPKEMKKYYSGKRMVGSNPQIRMGLTKNAVKSKHDDFDSANYLNKERKTDSETHRENIFKNAENHAKKKNESLLKEDTKSALDLYCDDISNEELNGYGRISSLTDAQVKTLLSIAKAVSNKYKVKSLISLTYNTKKDLQNWTKAATQSGVDSKVFNDYAKNVMYAYDELNESLTEDMNTTIVTNIVDWLADHETAWEDCCNYFGVDPDSEELYTVDKDELLDWVSEHKQLSSDLLRHWGAEWAIQESYKRNRKLKESFNYGDKLMGRAIPEGLYDEICRLLTDYENPNDAITPVTIDDFYDILVDVAKYSV